MSLVVAVFATAEQPPSGSFVVRSVRVFDRVVVRQPATIVVRDGRIASGAPAGLPGLCGTNYAWYFILSWLPSYLVRERRFSLSSLAFWGALPFLVMAVSSLGGGILADRWIARGSSPVKVRKAFLVTGLLLTAALLPSVLAPQLEWAVAGLLATCFTFGIYASNLFSLTQTLAGPDAAGRWTGLQNACGNLAGIVSPMLTGWMVQTTGSFATAFVGAGVACLAGASSFWFLVRERDRIELPAR